jgi:serine/threonine protein kinase
MEPVLGDVLATGGMGAVHDGQWDGRPVAVKVLAPAHAREEAYVRAFRTEARAMATLDHEAIVAVLALGRFETGPHAGCPYVVMERADGNLVDACGRHPWPWVAARLLSLLDGLAHAHARGITHRDLKPANVLLYGDAVRLADFGLARAFEAVEGGSREQPAGTPGYMPDEQRHGRWRDIGPWTDLYALGRLALDLVATPDGRSILVPEGFDRWVSRLRQPDAVDRYRRAADARAGLVALGEEATVELTDLAGLGSVVDSTLARTQPYFSDEDALQPALPEPLAITAPTWRPLPGRRSSAVREGLLDDLRNVLPSSLVPFVASAWDAVRTAHDAPVILQWVGEERDVEALALTMCHAVHETGLGTVNLATHDRHLRPDSGISGLVGREARCLDLEPRDALERLLASRHRADAAALADLLAPVTTGAPTVAPVEERFATLDRFLRRDAGPRLPFVWVERAHHATEMLDFLRWRSARPGSFLAVVTGARPVELDGVCVAIPAQATPAEERWREALPALLADPASRDPLVMAAVIGDRVREVRWRDALRRVRRTLPGGLLERILEGGIALPVGLGGDTWRFTSRGVRRQILEAGDDVLSAFHHTVGRTYPVEPATALIRAHHARAAGNPAEARDTLLAALPIVADRDPWVEAAIRAVLA